MLVTSCFIVIVPSPVCVASLVSLVSFVSLGVSHLSGVWILFESSLVSCFPCWFERVVFLSLAHFILYFVLWYLLVYPSCFWFVLLVQLCYPQVALTVTFWFFSVTLVLFNCFLQTFGSFSARLAFIKALMFSSLSFLMYIKHTIDIDVFLWMMWLDI